MRGHQIDSSHVIADGQRPAAMAGIEYRVDGACAQPFSNSVPSAASASIAGDVARG